MPGVLQHILCQGGRVWRLCLFAVLVLAAGPALSAPMRVAEDGAPRILVLHSYHIGYGWTDQQASAIAAVVSTAFPNAVQNVQFLDWKRHPSPAGLDAMEWLLRYRYEHTRPDIIITTDDAALSFGLRLRDEVFGPVPLIFGGVLEETAQALIQGQPNVTGVYQDLDVTGTLQMALGANPNATTVTFIADSTESGQGSIRQFAAALNSLRSDLETRILTGLSFGEIVERLSVLPHDGFVILGSYAGDDASLTTTPERLAERLAEASTVPVYALQHNLLGHGIVGGSLLSGAEHGRAVGQLAVGVLQGLASSSQPPLVRQSSLRAVDYSQLKDHELSLPRFPGVEEVMNKPFSFIETYRPLVVGVGVAFTILLVLVLVLVGEIRQRARAQAALCRANDELHTTAQRLRLIAESARDIMWYWDLTTGERVLSGRVEEMLGYEASALTTIDAWDRLVVPEDHGTALEIKESHLRGEVPEYRAEYRVLHRDGHVVWVFATGKAMFDDSGRAVFMAGSYTDITAEKHRQERLDYLAHYDALTGLPNRSRLAGHVDGLIAARSPDTAGGGVALLFIDMDNFKFINDSFGHKTGDQLLIDVARRLQFQAEPHSFVSRLGGDEFVVVVHDTTGAIEETARAVSRRLEQGFRAPFEIENQHFCMSCSIGVALHPRDGACFDDLLQNADTAMYVAKDTGRGRVSSFAPDMNRSVVERMRLHHRIRTALEHQAFSLHYQPQITAAGGAIRGFEALVRWTDAELGVVSPARFIPACEDSGMIIPLGAWVLDTACRQAVDLLARGMDDLVMSVNVSVVQLAQQDFPEQVLRTLERTGLAPRHLELEITESLMIGSVDAAVRKLTRLRDAGVRLALDDFGTGYSSLTYLRQLPIHTLKLDKSFIDEVDENAEARALAASMIRMARDMDLEVVAEGVEENAQLEALTRMGCGLIQGYLVSRPLAAERLADFIETWPTRRRRLPMQAMGSVVELAVRQERGA